MSRGLLVSEWIEQTGGAERVLDRLAGLFPDADMLCLWNDAPQRYPGRTVRETWLARTPLRRHKALALPLMPATWRIPQRDPEKRPYDWALVSSHAFAHHVNVGSPEVPKYVYVHTPARYLWAPELDARGDNLAARIAGPPLRAIDKRAAQEATSIAANSRFVADRVQRAWDREAVVIHPPVDVAWIRGGGWRDQLTDADRRVLDALPTDFVLGVSRFIPYKRLDVVMQAGDLLGIPVVIAGHGPLETGLRGMAAEVAVPVHFHIQPSDALVYALMARAHLRVPADRGLRHGRRRGDGRRHPGDGQPHRRFRRVGSGRHRRSAVRSAVARRDPRGRGGVRHPRRHPYRRARPAVRRHAVRCSAARVDESAHRVRRVLAGQGPVSSVHDDAIETGVSVTVGL